MHVHVRLVIGTLQSFTLFAQISHKNGNLRSRVYCGRLAMTLKIRLLVRCWLGSVGWQSNGRICLIILWTVSL